MRKAFEWIVAHPWVVIGFIVTITLGLGAAIPRITVLTDFEEYLSKDDPAVAAMEQAEERYGAQTLFMVAVEALDTIFKTSTLEKIAAMAADFEGIIGVDEVTSPLNAQVIVGTEKALIVGPAAPGEEAPKTSEAMEEYRQRIMGSRMLKDYIISSDGKAAVISIELKGDADHVVVAKQVVEIVERYKNPEKIYISGLPYMNLVLSESLMNDLRVLLPLVILMIVAVLFLSFWSLRGVLLPLLVVSLSTIWAMGAMALFNVPLTIMSFILPVILMAIGIAYCIHVLNKYYEEIIKGRSKREAVVETAIQMASPVTMAGLTTMAGFLSLLNSFLIPQRQFGVFTAFGVFAAMVLALTLIPSLLSLLAVPKSRVKMRQGLLSYVLIGFERLVARWKVFVLIISAVIFVAFLAGLPLLRVETSQREFLGEDHAVVQAINMMDRRFSGSEQILIEIDTKRRDGLKDPDILRRIVKLEEWLKTKQGINKTISIADLIREMNQKFHADDPEYYVIPEDRRLVAQLLLLFTFQGGELGKMALGDFSAGVLTGFYNSAGSAAQIKLVREVQAYLERNFTDIHAEMVGPTRIGGSLFARITTSQLTSLFTSIVIAGLIVTILMGSLVAGLISLIPLVLTVVVNFGVMAYSNTPLDMATLMVSSIAIGIGIDYAIHFLSRFRREYTLAGNPDSEKVLSTTFKTTGRGIAYNALTLALGFAVLLFSSFKGTSNFGLLIAMTMVISATSAFTVIPAILVAWKPKFLTKKSKGGQ